MSWRSRVDRRRDDRGPRSFNGIVYDRFHHPSYRNKDEAVAVAKELREAGLLARVVHPQLYNEWLVFVRPKDKSKDPGDWTNIYWEHHNRHLKKYLNRQKS